jgi:hypothetical protein
MIIDESGGKGVDEISLIVESEAERLIAHEPAQILAKVTHASACDTHIIGKLFLVPFQGSGRLRSRGIRPAEGLQIIPTADGASVFVSIPPSAVSPDGSRVSEIVVKKGEIHPIQSDSDIVVSAESLNSDVLFEVEVWIFRVQIACQVEQLGDGITDLRILEELHVVDPIRTVRGFPSSGPREVVYQSPPVRLVLL